jgi:hypothetical protein
MAGGVLAFSESTDESVAGTGPNGYFTTTTDPVASLLPAVNR